MKPIERAIKAFGSQTALAEAIGLKQPTISEWVCGDRPMPSERCAAIERVTKGAVKCEELRPDLRWERKPDPDWPWHPDGRPLLDVAAEAA